MPGLLALAVTTAGTVRRLEDHGLVSVTREIAERDPYAREETVPTKFLPVIRDAQRWTTTVFSTG